MLRLVADFFFGELFILELNNFFNRACTLAQTFPDSNDFLNDDGRARDGLHDYELPALDALGDDYLALTGEQWHGTHLAEVDADRILGFGVHTETEVKATIVGEFLFRVR